VVQRWQMVSQECTVQVQHSQSLYLCIRRMRLMPFIQRQLQAVLVLAQPHNRAGTTVGGAVPSSSNSLHYTTDLVAIQPTT
jgi:hypothetical protein